MSEENRKKASERMKAIQAAKKVALGVPAEPTVSKPEAPTEDVDALKARIKELEATQTTKSAEAVGKDKDAEIINAYQKSHRSIQDIARIFDVSVDRVLNLIGHGNLASVTFQGDMVDAGEAGPGATMNYGQTTKVPFSVN